MRMLLKSLNVMVTLLGLAFLTPQVTAQSGCDPANNPYSNAGDFNNLLHRLLDDPGEGSNPGDRFDPDLGSSTADCSTSLDELRAFLEAVCEAAHDGGIVTYVGSHSCGCDGSNGDPYKDFWTPDRLSQAVCSFLSRYGVENCECDELITAAAGCAESGQDLTVLQKNAIRACSGCTMASVDCIGSTVPNCDGGTCDALVADVDHFSQCMQKEQGRPPTAEEIADRICDYFTACASSIQYCEMTAECFARIGITAEMMETVYECLPGIAVIATPCETGCDGANKRANVGSCDVNGDGVVNCDDLLALAMQTLLCQQQNEWDDEEVDWCGLVRAWTAKCIEDNDGDCPACAVTGSCLGYLSMLGISGLGECGSSDPQCPCEALGGTSCPCGSTEIDCEGGCLIPGGCPPPCDMDGDGDYDCEDVRLLIESIRSCTGEVCLDCIVEAICKQMAGECSNGDKGRMCEAVSGCIEAAIGQPGAMSARPDLQTKLRCACLSVLPPLDSCGNVATKCDFTMVGCAECDGPDGGGSLKRDNELILVNGLPTQSDTDLNMELPSVNLRVTRTYYGAGCREEVSDPMQPAGDGWWMSSIMYAEEISGGSYPTIMLYGPNAHTVREYHHVAAAGSLPDRWVTGGAGQQYITADTMSYGTGTVGLWKIHEPGQFTMTLIRSTTSTSPAPVKFLWKTEDLYGRTNEYAYATFGGGSSRLSTIYAGIPAGLTSADAAAVVSFLWNSADASGTPSAAITGTLARMEAYRPNGSGGLVMTDSVDYRYSTGCGDLHSDVGAAGRLIQVVKSTRLNPDAAWGGRELYHKAVTQYRYDSSGLLKSVIKPEQVEFFAQKNAGLFSVGDPQDLILRAAEALLVKGDATTVNFADTNGSTILTVQDLASIVNTYSSGVLTSQLVQNACGCSGSTQSLKREYFYYGSAPYIAVAVRESVPGGGSSWVTHRDVITNMEALGTSGIMHQVSQAVVEYSSGTRTGRYWATRTKYAGTSTDEVRVSRNMTPSAIEYTPVFSSGGTWSSSGIPAISYKEDGLIKEYDYSADFRLTENRVVRVNSTAGGLDPTTDTAILLDKYTYDSTRPWLVTKHERFRVAGSSSPDDVETTDYSYGFYGGSYTDAVAWAKTEVEAELVAENGPGSPTKYVSYVLTDTDGLVHWTYSNDETLTRLDYDSHTGGVIAITRNADPGLSGHVLPSSWPSGGMSTSGWGSAWSSRGGMLVTGYQLDANGRVICQTAAGGVKSYTVRTLRSVDSRPGFPYYAVISLPYQFEDASTLYFDGVASISVSNAGGRGIESLQVQMDPTQSYDPVAGVFTFTGGTTAGRATSTHSLAGLVLEQRVWTYVGSGVTGDAPETSTVDKYLYDSLGRVARTIRGWQSGGTGSVTEYKLYDGMNRVLEVGIGTSESGSTTTVAKFAYDDPTPTDGTLDQGVGNGHLNVSRSFNGESGTGALSSTSFRDTVKLYDWRERLTDIRNPTTPHEVLVYDNLDRVTERGLFNSTPSGMSHTNRTLYAKTAYSQRGLAYRQSVAIDPTQSSPTFLASHTWYDSEGRVIESWGPNAPATKRTYDAHGRPTTSIVCDRLGDPAPGTSSNHAAAVPAGWSGNNVLEQVEMTYEQQQESSPGQYATGKRLLVTTRRRFHDSTATGQLTGSSAITMYVGYAYDPADRVIQTVNFGTNNTSFDIFSNGSAPTWPGSPPTHSIISKVAYDARGRVDFTTDPLDRVTKFKYDDVDRQVAVIENWQSGSPAGFAWVTDQGGRWKVSSGMSGSSPDQNRVTSYVYDDLGNVRLQVAHLPPDGSTEKVQITEYNYGTTVGSVSDPGDSLIASADLLSAVHYPDESTGLPGSGSTYTVAYAFNALGELRSVTDQNGTLHAYSRDGAGRVLEDRATKGSGTDVDDSIRLIAVSYDSNGRMSKVSSFDALSSGTKKNEVEYLYTPLWQIERIFQNPVGAVARSGNTPGTDTRVVVYTYSDAASPTSGTYSAGSNYSRLASMTYPKMSSSHSDHAMEYLYGSSASVDDRIDRVATLEFDSNPSGSPTVAAYQWIGLGMPAKVEVIGYELDYSIVNRNDRFEPGDVTGLRDGMRSGNDLYSSTHLLAGKYAGYDRFGRVSTHIWATAGFGPRSDATVDQPNTRQHFQENYAYDKASNRLTRDDRRRYTIAADRDEDFSYDGLYRLIEAERGLRGGGGTLTSAPKSQRWVLDMLGNWASVRTDLTGDGTYADAGDVWDDRGAAGTSSSGHNMANELTQRIIKNGTGSSPVTLPLTYDHAGNMRETTRTGAYSGDWRYTHDCWNRLVKVEKKVGGSYTSKVLYTYNGLHWRTTETVMGALVGASGDRVTRMYYSAAWQLLWEETDESNAGSSTWESKTDKTYANLYGLRGLDDLIGRFIDGRTSGGTAPDGAYGAAATQDAAYAILTDPQLSVREVMSVATGGPRERWRYSAYGEPEKLDLGDYNLDGMIDFFDYDDQAYELDYPLAAPDDMRADVNGDGFLDSFDLDAFSLMFDPDSDPRPAPSMRHKYCGYLEDSVSGLMLARFRWYEPVMGRWVARDPILYLGGANLYQYCSSMPSSRVDPSGLYDLAGHFYTVFMVARCAKVPIQDALKMAYFAQLPDRVEEFDATNAGYWLVPDALTVKKAVLSDEDRQYYNDVQQILHSLHGGDEAASERRQKCLGKLLSDEYKDLDWKRGFLIHAFGDSFAHRTESGDAYPTKGIGPGGRGHAFDNHLPDIISTNVERYRDYCIMMCQSAFKSGFPFDGSPFAAECQGLWAKRKDETEDQARSRLKAMAQRNGLPEVLGFDIEGLYDPKKESEWKGPTRKEVASFLQEVRKKLECCDSELAKKAADALERTKKAK